MSQQPDTIIDFNRAQLSAVDLKTLSRPFVPDEHENLKGRWYITEYAVCNRIEEVDPMWTFEILKTEQRDKAIHTYARMTIKGVSRDGVGTELIKMTKDGGNEANEAEKSSATDALKRCGRLFGIGRYLLTLPKGSRKLGDVEFTNWLYVNHIVEPDLPADSWWHNPDDLNTYIDWITVKKITVGDAKLWLGQHPGMFPNAKSASEALRDYVQSGRRGEARPQGEPANPPAARQNQGQPEGQNELFNDYPDNHWFVVHNEAFIKRIQPYAKQEAKTRREISQSVLKLIGKETWADFETGTAAFDAVLKKSEEPAQPRNKPNQPQWPHLSLANKLANHFRNQGITDADLKRFVGQNLQDLTGRGWGKWQSYEQAKAAIDTFINAQINGNQNPPPQPPASAPTTIPEATKQAAMGQLFASGDITTKEQFDNAFASLKTDFMSPGISPDDLAQQVRLELTVKGTPMPPKTNIPLEGDTNEENRWMSYRTLADEYGVTLDMLDGVAQWSDFKDYTDARNRIQAVALAQYPPLMIQSVTYVDGGSSKYLNLHIDGGVHEGGLDIRAYSRDVFRKLDGAGETKWTAWVESLTPDDTKYLPEPVIIKAGQWKVGNNGSYFATTSPDALEVGVLEGGAASIPF